MDETIRIGDRVRLKSTGEVGVVIWAWDDPAGTDAYVAFFGSEFPAEKPHAAPYVLRYASTSLEKLTSSETNPG
jgi:hypothetical protein